MDWDGDCVVDGDGGCAWGVSEICVEICILLWAWMVIVRLMAIGSGMEVWSWSCIGMVGVVLMVNASLIVVWILECALELEFCWDVYCNFDGVVDRECVWYV